MPLNNPEFSAHQKLPEGADVDDPATYARFSGHDFAPDMITEQALRFMRENRDRPFFFYHPTTAPHLALQVPEDSLKEYKGKFPEQPYPGGHAYLPHRTPCAAYAAMVTRMDREVGRMMQLAKELGLDDQTIFIFTSDNGPLYDQLGGTDEEFFNTQAASAAARARSMKGAFPSRASSAGTARSRRARSATGVGFERLAPHAAGTDRRQGCHSCRDRRHQLCAHAARP